MTSRVSGRSATMLGLSGAGTTRRGSRRRPCAVIMSKACLMTPSALSARGSLR
jgi:hypothetical protein